MNRALRTPHFSHSSRLASFLTIDSALLLLLSFPGQDVQLLSCPDTHGHSMQVHGMDVLLTLSNLERLGLLKKYESTSAGISGLSSQVMSLDP